MLTHMVHGYLSAGLTSVASALAFRGTRPPRSGVNVRPYVALGFGWNWLLENRSVFFAPRSPQDALLYPLFLLVLPLLFAGRVELRYTASPGDGRDFLSVMLGAGS